MKLFAFLLSAATLLGLAAYDFYSFNRVAEAQVTIDELSSLLDLRGRERYIAEKHYGDWMATTSQNNELYESFQSGPLFENRSIFSRSTPAVANWPDIVALQAKLENLQSAKAQYSDIPFTAQDLHLNQIAVGDWKRELVEILDELQNLDIQLSHYLSQWVNHTLQKIVYINVILTSTMFVIVIAAVYYDEHRQLVASREVNEKLKLRQNQQEKFRKVLLSLMEDLSLERNAATRLSQQLQHANNEMQRKNEEMEQFIYTVSHDLKSPLVTIGGFARKLTQDLSGQIAEKQQHYLNRIQSNVDHMDVLLSDLLELSRVIRQDLEKSLVETESVVAKQISVLEGVISDSGAEIKVFSPLRPILANERLLSQCVLNLLGNAVKYRDKSRRLSIEVTTDGDDAQTRLCVSDNGSGIDEKYHQQIFRIFERLGYGEGTGVGLTIVKTIMDRHAGTVKLESEPGVGSKFTLIFPNVNGELS